MELKARKILITGADGFIGSHLVETLLDLGCEVRALTYYNSFNSWGWLDTFPADRLKRLDVVCGDIRDHNGVFEAVEGCDAVFHLAALIGIPFSYHSPDSYVDTNILGTLNVLQAARHHGVGRVLVTSTSEVYGTARYVPIDENHPLQAQSPYSATKIGAEAIATSFYNSFGTPVVIARPFNAYGPRQSARAVIPAIISQIASGAKQVRVGNIDASRDFNYVKDVCLGLVGLVGADSAVGQVVNIGSDTEISISGLFELIRQLMESDAVLEVESARLRPEKSEVQRLRCDNRKIRALTGYLPEWSLEAGLRSTIKWFTCPENLNRYKPGIYNV